MAQNEVYLGNPNLKKANIAQDFTKEQIAEFIRCAEDPVYFIKLMCESYLLTWV